MPRELLMLRKGRGLLPATRFDEEAVFEIPFNVPVLISVSKTPYPKMRSWYRALLALLVSATGAWPTPQEAHRQLLVRCGFGKAVMISAAGEIRVTAPSTADWDLFEWRQYLDILIDVLSREYFHTIPTPELLREVEQMAGTRYEEIER